MTEESDHLPKEPSRTYYSKAPVERTYREHFLDSEDLFRPFFGRSDDSPLQKAVDKFEEMCSSLRRQLHISDTRYQEAEDELFTAHDSPISTSHVSAVVPGPSIYQEHAPSFSQWHHTLDDTMGLQLYDYEGPSSDLRWTRDQPWEASPAVCAEAPNEQDQVVAEEHALHHLRYRPLRASDTYTLGSKTIPRRGRARRH